MEPLSNTPHVKHAPSTITRTFALTPAEMELILTRSRNGESVSATIRRLVMLGIVQDIRNEKAAKS